MTKKFLFLNTAILFFCISCTKNIDGVLNLKNWKLDWAPNFGLALLNANISYSDLKNMIPQDSNFTVTAQSIGNGDSILVLHANQNILSALNDFFILQNFSYNPTNLLPIGGGTPQPAIFQIPLTQLINLKGVTGTIQSIKFANGIINLKLQGNGVKNINSISASLGGVPSGSISATNNNEIIVPIHLKDQTITITSDNIALNITMDSKSGTLPLQASLSLTSENLGLTAITVKDFSYTATPIETSISMNFFDKINNGNPNFKLVFNQGVQLTLNYNNQAGLNVSIPSITVDYTYKNGTNPTSQTISGITTNKNQSFNIQNISSLLTKVTFKVTPTITSNNSIILSKTANVELKGSVDIPLDVNIQGVNYETNIDLPKITDTKILDALENLTIKTSSNNGFPVELKCILRILNEAGQKMDSLDLGDIIKGENTNTTKSFDKKKIQTLVSTGKGQVVLGISTKDATTGKFTTQQKLSLRLGLSIKANGKEILNSL